jgi:hypothetical protein
MQTTTEAKLWASLRNRQLGGVKLLAKLQSAPSSQTSAVVKQGS